MHRGLLCTADVADCRGREIVDLLHVLHLHPMQTRECERVGGGEFDLDLFQNFAM